MIAIVSPTSHRRLWAVVTDELNCGVPGWRSLIDGFGQVAAAERRASGKSWSDNEVLEAILLAILSNSTDWSKIARIKSDLATVFQDFNLAAYAERKQDDVEAVLVPWFKSHRAGSMTLRQDLKALIRSSQALNRWSQTNGRAEAYFTSIAANAAGDYKQVALAIGDPTSKFKLPGLGVALGAECLRNMGFDISKPDRHINRAAGCFGLVKFARWKDEGTSAPSASIAELNEVMTAMENWARSIGEKVSFLDNAVWLLCAKMGLHRTNDRLRKIAAKAQTDDCAIESLRT